MPKNRYPVRTGMVKGKAAESADRKDALGGRFMGNLLFGTFTVQLFVTEKEEGIGANHEEVEDVEVKHPVKPDEYLVQHAADVPHFDDQ
jgi:hypothetical protein